MATVSKFPTGNATVTGTWTNGTTGLNADDGTHASFTTTTKNDSRNILAGTFGFHSDIPAGSTINSVSIEVQEQVSSGGTLRTVIERAGVAGANNDNTTDTALTVRTFSNLTRPGGGSWVRDDLSDANLKVRVYGLQPNNTTSRTYQFDYVKVTVDYTVNTDLVVAGGTHAHSAGNLALTQVHSLVAASSSHAHTAQNLSLTQTHVLAIQDASHTHTAQEPAVVQVSDLAIDVASHGHSSGTLALTQAHSLTIEDSSHAHEAESTALTQLHELTVSGSLHDHTAENVALEQESGATDLTIQDSTHAHTAENVSPNIPLVIQGSEHAHTSASPSLIQQHDLAIQNASHGHAADNVELQVFSFDPRNLEWTAGPPHTKWSPEIPETRFTTRNVSTTWTTEEPETKWETEPPEPKWKAEEARL